MNRIGVLVASSIVVVCAACGDSNKVVPQHGRAPASQPPPPPPPPPPRDPENVPDHGPAAPCTPATGDARAMRTRLRALERGRDPAPPEAASLLEGCAATPRDIAKSLEKAGRAIARQRAHDYALASLFYRRALEIDPSYVPARLSLAGARSKLGNFDGAMYQLDQIKASGTAGARTLERVYTDGALVALRLTPRFWTWAGNPVPEMVAMLPGGTETPLTSVGTSLSFTPPLVIPPDVIFARVSLSGPHYRTLATAVGGASGGRLSHPTSVSREKLVSPWLDHLDAIGGSLLLRASAFRFGDGKVVLALPFLAGEEGDQRPVVVIAMGPEAGPFDIVKIIASTSACEEPVLFSSGDRRVLGYFTSCTSGEDPTPFSRCIVSGEGGRVVSRCGAGASTASIVGGASGDDGEEEYGDEYAEEDYEEEEPDYD